MPRKMDDDIRSPFPKRYEYKEHSSYHSFRLNDVLIIQNIVAFFIGRDKGPGRMEN